MRKVVIGAGLGVVLACWGSAAMAETYVHSEAKVEIWAPDNWDVDQEDDSMTMTQPDGEASMVFVLFQADELDDAIDGLVEGLGEFVDDVELTDEPQDGKVNGMDTMVANASGNIDGSPVTCGILLISTPSDKILMGLGIMATKTVKKHVGTINQILKGIKPMEESGEDEEEGDDED